MISPKFGPTNYAACAGTGAGGGTPLDTDGVFYVNSRTRIAQISDGTSHTALMSESVLGPIKGQTPAAYGYQQDYKFTLLVPLTTNNCNATNQWNVSDPRGFGWVNGEYRCTLYNHAYLPNQATPDCIAAPLIGGVKTVYTPYGWRGTQPPPWRGELAAGGRLGAVCRQCHRPGIVAGAVDDRRW